MKGLMTLSRSLAFAVVAGLAAPLFVACVRPFVGSASALSLYALSVAAVYVFGLAARPSLGFGAALGLALPASALWLFGGSPAEVAFLCAGLMGVMRSGWLRRDRRRGAGFARAFAIEVVLLGVGLWLAAWAGQGSISPVAMGVWSFFLVQSAFCLIGGPSAVEARTAPLADVDPFEAAIRRAQSLLEKGALG
jgi:hypothetical protein